MSEMALTAEHLIVVGRGELIADISVAAFVAQASSNVVTVWSPQAYELREALVGPDVTVTSSQPGELEVHGLTAKQIGDIAFDNAYTVQGHTRGIVLINLAVPTADSRSRGISVEGRSLTHRQCCLGTGRVQARPVAIGHGLPGPAGPPRAGAIGDFPIHRQRRE